MYSNDVDDVEPEFIVFGHNGSLPVEWPSSTPVKRLVLRNVSTDAVMGMRIAIRALPYLSDVEWHNDSSSYEGGGEEENNKEASDGEMLAEALCDLPSLQCLTPAMVSSYFTHTHVYGMYHF